MWLRIAIETSHHSAAVPLLVLILLRRGFPREYWLLAFAFSVSWFVDTIVASLHGSFAVDHLYVGLQLAIVAGAMAPNLKHILLATFMIACLATVAPFVGVAQNPSVFVTASAGMVALWYLKDWKHELAISVALYVVLASILRIWMYEHIDERAAFMPIWYAYLATRLSSFGLFIHAAYKWREA